MQAAIAQFRVKGELAGLAQVRVNLYIHTFYCRGLTCTAAETQDDFPLPALSKRIIPSSDLGIHQAFKTFP